MNDGTKQKWKGKLQQVEGELRDDKLKKAEGYVREKTGEVREGIEDADDDK